MCQRDEVADAILPTCSHVKLLSKPPNEARKEQTAAITNARLVTTDSALVVNTIRSLPMRQLNCRETNLARNSGEAERSLPPSLPPRGRAKKCNGRRTEGRPNRPQALGHA
jgi:hypothetical protein